MLSACMLIVAMWAMGFSGALKLFKGPGAEVAPKAEVVNAKTKIKTFNVIFMVKSFCIYGKAKTMPVSAKCP